MKNSNESITAKDEQLAIEDRLLSDLSFLSLCQFLGDPHQSDHNYINDLILHMRNAYGRGLDLFTSDVYLTSAQVKMILQTPRVDHISGYKENIISNGRISGLSSQGLYIVALNQWGTKDYDVSPVLDSMCFSLGTNYLYGVIEDKTAVLKDPKKIISDAFSPPVKSRVNTKVTSINTKARKKDIYLIGNREHNVLKIGISSDVPSRMASLQTSCPYHLDIFSVHTVRNARRLERSIHDLLKSERITGEWFNLAASETVVYKQLFSAISSYGSASRVKQVENLLNQSAERHCDTQEAD